MNFPFHRRLMNVTCVTIFILFWSFTKECTKGMIPMLYCTSKQHLQCYSYFEKLLKNQFVHIKWFVVYFIATAQRLYVAVEYRSSKNHAVIHCPTINVSPTELAFVSFSFRNNAMLETRQKKNKKERRKINALPLGRSIFVLFSSYHTTNRECVHGPLLLLLLVFFFIYIKAFWLYKERKESEVKSNERKNRRKKKKNWIHDRLSIGTVQWTSI